MPPKIPRDQMPTIGSMRRQGMHSLQIICVNVHCRHTAMIRFDALGMDDAVIFIEIPHSRRFRCTKCGHRQVEVFPDWTPVRAVGRGVPGQ